MKKAVFQWLEEYLFIQKRSSQKVLSLLFRPLSWLYCFMMKIRRHLAVPKTFPLPVISVGNLTLGGNGKTPFTIALTQYFSGACVVMRGYGRVSKGVVVVNHQGHVLCDVYTSGDEAMEIALSSPDTTVIVCEKREEGIEKAVELGCDFVILDDGFSKVNLKKFDIILEAQNPPPPYCLPSGPYRESPLTQKYVDCHLREGRDFFREVTLLSPSSSMVLITSIAKAWRLDPYLPKEVTHKMIKPDHSFFTFEELDEIIQTYHPTSLLVTMKDYVKLSTYPCAMSVLSLTMRINDDVLKKVEAYLTQFHKDSGTIDQVYTKEHA